jgi:hypothetical protein
MVQLEADTKFSQPPYPAAKQWRCLHFTRVDATSRRGERFDSQASGPFPHGVRIELREDAPPKFAGQVGTAIPIREGLRAFSVGQV